MASGNQPTGFVGYTAEELTQGWTDPVNAIPVTILLGLLLLYGKPKTWTAVWVLINAFLIHPWMDGVVGAFGRGPLWLVNEYAVLDARYWPTQDATVMGVSIFEFILMAPACIFWYAAEQKRSFVRHAFAFLASAFQFMGTFLYIFGEAWNGFHNVPLDWPPQFDTYFKLKYFWFVFVFMNSLWVVIPLAIVASSIKACLAIKEKKL